MANRFGQLVDTKASGGLTIAKFWTRILEVNEFYWKEAPDYVMTDEDLQLVVQKAFPSRSWSKGMLSSVRYRAAYNRGGLTEGTIPMLVSYRYSRELGRVVRWEAARPRAQWTSKPCQSRADRIQVSDIIAGTVPKS